MSIYARLVFSLLLSLEIQGCQQEKSIGQSTLRSELAVESVDPQLRPPRFQWINDETLIALVANYPGEKSAKWAGTSLISWNTVRNLTREISPPDSGGLCVIGDEIKYFRRELPRPPSLPETPEYRMHFKGVPGKEIQIEFQEPMDLMTCKSKADLRKSAAAEAATSLGENIVNLRPNHGFIVIDRDSPVDWPRSMSLHIPGKGHPVDITKIIEGSGPNQLLLIFHPKWYEHKGAYYIPSLRKGGSSWWLKPNGELEVAWTISKSGVKYPSQRMTQSEVSLTSLGPVVGLFDYGTKSIGHSGLYFITSKNTLKKIATGRVGEEIEISPNGCKIAFANDERLSTSANAYEHYPYHKLQIIDICQEAHK